VLFNSNGPIEDNREQAKIWLEALDVLKKHYRIDVFWKDTNSDSSEPILLHSPMTTSSNG